ncbi:hypothetical protein [Pseudomonas fulva]|uniref:hypothetical protein n=1 Tax=Pseudomonas fulva TaxID=47880 RepID=UPI002480F315|nr:hypothetical protein [Pseudomonas fulva]
MANRSKKVVLSARIDPYLKAGMELAATAKNEKIVKMMEEFIETGLAVMTVDNPFLAIGSRTEKTSFMLIFKCIWSEDEAVYKMRAGGLGPAFAGEYLFALHQIVFSEEYFRGEDDLYGDLNGFKEKLKLTPPKRPVNLKRIRDEWSTINDYCEFLSNNKPFFIQYLDYKRMAEESKAK